MIYLLDILSFAYYIVLLMLVEWIFQHVQTEIWKKQKQKQKQKQPADPKFWSMLGLCQYKNFCRP